MTDDLWTRTYDVLTAELGRVVQLIENGKRSLDYDVFVRVGQLVDALASLRRLSDV